MATKIIHITLLVLLLVGGIASFAFLGGDTKAQFTIGVVISLSYIAWGILHHYAHRDLHPKVVIEYVLIGVVAILVLMAVLQR